MTKPDRTIYLLTWAIASVGVASRLWHYSANYSLNHDDAALAVNVLERSIGQLREALLFGQLAPWGFLAAEKAVTFAIGGSELALRLLPMLAAVVAVPMFAYLSRQWLRPAEALISQSLFCASQALAGSSALVKQYSLEVLFAIVLVVLARPIVVGTSTSRGRMALGLVGAVSVWFTFAPIFVMAGVAFAGISGVTRTRPKYVTPIALCWAMSAAVYALFVLRLQLVGTPMFSMWASEFLPRDLRTWPAWGWHCLENIGSVSSSVRLAPLFAMAVVVAVVRTSFSRRPEDLTLAAVVAATVGGACVRRYPFVGRFIFFLAPIALLWVASSVGDLVRHGRLGVRVLAVAAAALCTGYAFVSLAKNVFTNDPGFDDPRGVVQELSARMLPTDVLCASEAAVPSLRYYTRFLGFPNTVLNDDGQSACAAPRASIADDPTPAREWFMFFSPSEGEFDRAVLARLGRGGSVAATIVRKRHTAVLWLVTGQILEHQ